jgi:hypothetical protein
MKYLKYFEKYKGKYWLVDTKYLEIAVNKLKLSEKQKYYLLNNSYINGKEEHYSDGGDYYVDSIYLPVSDDECYMSWMPGNEPGVNNEDYFKKNFGYKYMGKLEITPEDIIQHEMPKNAKKYNI